MSTDEVLASNLWPWPDPLLKRDKAGQILFVNAAFLQLYGGRVEDWYGKILAGWPAPVSVGAQRFELRAGVAPDENVFDWVENVMADGNVLAIARNVTVFMTEPTLSVEEIVPAQTEPQIQMPAQIAVQNAAPIAVQEPPAFAPVAPQPVFEMSVQAEPSPAQVKQLAEQQATPDISFEFEDMFNKREDEHTYADNKVEQAAPENAAAPLVAEQMTLETQEPVSEPVLEPVQQVTAQAPVQPAPAPQMQEDARMIERRALPIKDSESVLGSNWRDQVIAKAVGGCPLGADTDTDKTDKDFEETASKPSAGLQILLAEDNAINALLTRTLLEVEGAEVDTVEDGALALEAVGKKNYDLIFMDMRMPNMDGLESTRKIRAFGSTMPIIALTANAFDDDRNACFDSGMNDFMTKPVSAEELSEMVINWTKEEKQKLAS